MMQEVTLGAALLVGLLGTSHCAGMCGGIMGSLTAGIEPDRRQDWRRSLPLLLAYNSGRIFSYAIAGGIAGWIGSQAFAIPMPGGIPLPPLIAGLFMVLLGLYLAGWTKGLLWLERAGGHIWKRLAPLAGRLLPVKSVGQALPLGMLWGWLPCGMVYSMLAWAVTTADPVQSAALMTAFGLGTLPALVAMGLLAKYLVELRKKLWIRRLAGASVMAMGLVMAGNALLHEPGEGKMHQHHHHSAVSEQTIRS